MVCTEALVGLKKLRINITLQVRDWCRHHESAFVHFWFFHMCCSKTYVPWLPPASITALHSGFYLHFLQSRFGESHLSKFPASPKRSKNQISVKVLLSHTYKKKRSAVLVSLGSRHFQRQNRRIQKNPYAGQLTSSAVEVPPGKQSSTFCMIYASGERLSLTRANIQLICIRSFPCQQN